MGYIIGIGILSILLVIFILWLRFSLKSRFNLESYIILLLMEDGIRERQKIEFQEWIQKRNFKNASELHRQARFIISYIANSFAKKDLSFFSAHKILWNFKSR